MKRSIISTGLVLLILVGVVGLLRCCASTPGSVELAAAFTPQGALRVTHLGGAMEVRVLDAGGLLLATGKAHGRDTAELVFSWTPGSVYRIRTDAGSEAEVRAPESPPLLALRLHAPLGQPPTEVILRDPLPKTGEHRVPVRVSPGETLDIMLEIEKLSDDRPDLAVDVHSEVTGDMGGADLSQAWDAADEALSFEFDKHMYTARLRMGKTLPGGEVMVRVSSDDFDERFHLSFEPAALEAGTIRLAAWDMPTDALGNVKTGRPRDQVVMPNRVWGRLASWVGIRPMGHEATEAYTFQRIDVKNGGNYPVTLLIAGEGLDPATRRESRFFDPPTWDAGGGTNRTVAYLRVGAGETGRCVLPVYVAPDTPAGEYLRRIRVTALGSDHVLLEEERPFAIVRTKTWLTLWVAGVAALIALWLGGCLIFYQRLVRSFGVRTLVLLSLLGSLQFCLSFAGGWVSSVLYALLGPFNCLVGGFLTEVLTYLIVTAILYLVPRVGAMTIAGVISYLMGGIMFGTFGLADLLFVGSALAFREIFLLAFGVTRFHPGPGKPPALLPMMLALGFADAAATFTNLALFAVLYRLFYAPWFIVMNVAITGFLYTCVGVWLGRSLGRSLREVRP